MDVDVDMNSDPNLTEHDSLMQHIILPRKLPQKKSPYLYATEFEIMNQMVKTVESLSSWIPPKTVEMFQRLQRVHSECTPETISNEINALQPGDTFAMFVRFQFCAFMIHVPKKEQVNDVQNVIVASIPGSLHPSEIYKHDSDIKVNFVILAFFIILKLILF